jgi:hypothetical protein
MHTHTVSVELSEVLSEVICTNADWFSILYSNHHLTEQAEMYDKCTLCINALQEQKTSLSSKISIPDLQNTLPSYSVDNGELLHKQ